MRAIVLLTAAMALALVCTPAQAEQAPDDHELRSILQELVRMPGGPPGAIVVLRHGDRTKIYRAGAADLDTGLRPRPDDHMRIASVSKAFSGAVALSLVDLKKLSLDDTIGERLPQLPAAWGDVTLRHLLNHTSGLPDYTESPRFREELTADPRRRFDSRRLLDYVADDPLRFPPGSQYRYSNSDSIAVALMAEAVSGRSYENLLKSVVFNRLHLRSTSLPQHYLLPRPFLHGYEFEPPDPPGDVSTAFGASGVWASGGIVSTPNDLTAFIRAYAGGKLISPKTRAQQLRFVDGSSEPAGPGRNEAGLAIFRYTTRCGVVLGHTGNFFGYTQLAVATPDGRRSLTFSITTRVSGLIKPEILAKLRSIQEEYVCALLCR
jgi:D-alanyl-D-alanine carboxypeptidase